MGVSDNPAAPSGCCICRAPEAAVPHFTALCSGDIGLRSSACPSAPGCSPCAPGPVASWPPRQGVLWVTPDINPLPQGCTLIPAASRRDVILALSPACPSLPFPLRSLVTRSRTKKGIASAIPAELWLAGRSFASPKPGWARAALCSFPSGSAAVQPRFWHLHGRKLCASHSPLPAGNPYVKAGDSLVDAAGVWIQARAGSVTLSSKMRPL